MANLGGAPVGNKNAARAKVWRHAIIRALEKRGKTAGEELERLADKLIMLCHTGDSGALKELGDRLDGKPAQEITGADGDAIVVQASITQSLTTEELREVRGILGRAARRKPACSGGSI